MKPEPHTHTNTDNPYHLTYKQLNWVSAYLQPGGPHNATQAAREAGYKGGPNSLARRGFENLHNSKVQQELARRTALAREETKDRRERRLRDLDAIIDDPDTLPRDRIAAMQLQGKMLGWLSETRVLETPDRARALGEAERRVAERAALLLHDTRLLPDGTYAPDPPESARGSSGPPPGPAESASGTAG